MEVKINQKELIKRAKELVNMIETNEIANELTKKLRAVEGELEAKEEFAYKMANWNRLLLEKVCSPYGEWSLHRFRYEMIEHKYTPSSPYRKISLLFRVEHELVFRLDESISEGEDKPEKLLEIKEHMYGKLMNHILQLGVAQLRPKVSYQAKSTDRDFLVSDISQMMQQVGMQVQRPASMRTVYEAFDFPDINNGRVIDLRKK